MTSISPSILQSLTTMVGEAINFICLVEYDYQKWYLALGRTSFYFIDENLKKYKDPSIPYRKIQACRLCMKHKTLMQIALHKDEEAYQSESNDPSAILEKKLRKTYG